MKKIISLIILLFFLIVPIAIAYVPYVPIVSSSNSDISNGEDKWLDKGCKIPLEYAEQHNCSLRFNQLDWDRAIYYCISDELTRKVWFNCDSTPFNTEELGQENKEENIDEEHLMKILIGLLPFVVIVFGITIIIVPFIKMIFPEMPSTKKKEKPKIEYDDKNVTQKAISKEYKKPTKKHKEKPLRKD